MIDKNNEISQKLKKKCLYPINRVFFHQQQNLGYLRNSLELKK